MSPFSFEVSLPTLNGRRNSKWRGVPSGVIGAGIAEMDFPVAPVIRQALQGMVDAEEFGYLRPTREDTNLTVTLAKLLARRMRERHDWNIDPERVQTVSSLDQAITACLLAYSDTGEGVVQFTPCYPPYLQSMQETGRQLVDVPLRDTGTQYALDLDQLRANVTNVSPTTRILMLCNPQNPTGRVFTREELQAVADMALEHNLVIVSDEINADLVYAGKKHIPIANLSDEVARRTVTLTSASKSFNIPGVRCGFMHFGSEDLQQRFYAHVPRSLLGVPGGFAYAAIQAAWTEGQPWLDAATAHLERMRDLLVQTVQSDMPGVRVYAPEGTFLAWLDFRALNLPVNAGEFLLRECRVGPLPGEWFSGYTNQYARLNFATSEAVLQEILERLTVGAAEGQGLET